MKNILKKWAIDFLSFCACAGPAMYFGGWAIPICMGVYSIKTYADGLSEGMEITRNIRAT